MSEKDFARTDLEDALQHVENRNLDAASTRTAEAASHIQASDHSVLKLNDYKDEMESAANGDITTDEDVERARHAITSILNQL